MNRSALLLIDPQNDFCDPLGSLYVPGADADMLRVANLIQQLGHRFDHIYITLDSHVKLSIFHPCWFQNADGQSAKPFTPVSSDDLRNGRWNPVIEPEWTLNYLHLLEEQGEYRHTIWPEHCLVGTWGHQIYTPVMNALLEWSSAHHLSYTPIFKGLSATTEHYGAFSAQIELPNAPETQVNKPLMIELGHFNRIYLAGEASSHCVAKSLEQLLNWAPELATRLVVLVDCMSPVPGFESLAEGIYGLAEQSGVNFKRSTDLS